MLGVVDSSLKMVKVFTQYVVPNNIALCCIKMLRSFRRGLQIVGNSVAICCVKMLRSFGRGLTREMSTERPGDLDGGQSNRTTQNGGGCFALSRIFKTKPKRTKVIKS